MYTSGLLGDASVIGLLTGGDCTDPSDVFPFHHLSGSVSSNLEKQWAGNHTLATILSDLFCCSMLSPEANRSVVWSLVHLIVLHAKAGQQGGFRKETGSALFLIPPFCTQGESTCLQ